MVLELIMDEVVVEKLLLMKTVLTVSVVVVLEWHLSETLLLTKTVVTMWSVVPFELERVKVAYFHVH